MSYCGDSSLSGDIQERVTDTFGQTLELARDGKKVEALLGCDFILRLDPLFEPARMLQETIQNDTPVDVEALSAMAGVEVDSAPSLGTRPPSSPAPQPAPEAPAEVVEDTAPAPLQDEPQEAEPEPAELADGGGVDHERGEGPDSLEATEPIQPPELAEPPLPHVEDAEPSDSSRERESMDALLGRPDDDSDSGEGTDIVLEGEDRGSKAVGDVPDRIKGPTGGPPPTPEERRVQALLEEGQRRLDEGKHQEAIDAWSRIFLIEMDHAEANECIEGAQRLKAERERELEERFNDASALIDDGDLENALQAFEELLVIAPDHIAAQEIVEQLKSAKAPGAEATPPEEPPKAKDGDTDPALAPPPSEPPEPVTDEDVVEPTVIAPPPPPPPARAQNWRFIAIGSGVLAVVAVIALLLMQNWGSLFPNSNEEAASARQPVDRVARITLLYERGDTEQALEALRQIREDSPDYQRAQLLLEEWTAGEPLSEEEQAAERDRLALIEQAREAYEAQEYLGSARLFLRANATAPLEGAEAALFEDARRQLEPIASLIDLYTQREYERVLPGLWRYYEENPENRDVRRLLINSNYNMAVRALRRGQAKRAEASVEEAVRLDMDDAYAQRLLLFSQTYADAPRDLLYEIFIDNLEIRP